MMGNPPPFDALFEFVLAHPYWIDQGESPYQAALPDNLPSYCGI
jgi:hypothetical protein